MWQTLCLSSSPSLLATSSKALISFSTCSFILLHLFITVSLLLFPHSLTYRPSALFFNIFRDFFPFHFRDSFLFGFPPSKGVACSFPVLSLSFFTQPSLISVTTPPLVSLFCPFISQSPTWQPCSINKTGTSLLWHPIVVPRLFTPACPAQSQSHQSPRQTLLLKKKTGTAWGEPMPVTM